MRIDLNHPDKLFGQFERLRRELDEVFGVSGLPSSIRSVAPGTVPAVNVGRTPTSVEIYAFAPGLDASKLEAPLDRGVVRISGQRVSGITLLADRPGVPKDQQQELKIEGGVQRLTPDGLEAVYAEMRVPRCRRSFTLSRELDTARIEANLKDGVLTLRIPKQARAQPRRIAVSSG